MSSQELSEAPPAVSNPHQAGVCPVKAEFLVPAPPKVSLDAEQRTRGMNTGKERERSQLVQGTERPKLEGELNFFAGEALGAIKTALKQAKQQQKQKQSPSSASQPSLPRATDSATAAIGLKRDRDDVVAPVDATKSDADDGTARPQGEERWRELLHAQEKHRGLFRNKYILAPLTTVGNLPFRRICKEFGADVTMSEMAVVYNLNRTQKSEWSLLRRHESENIFGIQLAVSNPYEASQFATALEASGFSYDFLDINGGCPIDAMNRNGCGCALIERRGQRLKNVVRELVECQSRPVSVKCRVGADEDYPSLHRDIPHFESFGASAVTIHGRSRKQRYTKLANWSYAEQCAQLTSLPVVGNGDILGWEDVEEHRRQCPTLSSFMLGRGALIKPWLFEEVKSGQVKDMSSSERFEVLKRFCSYGLSHWGSDERGVMTTRRFLCEWLSFFCRYVPVGLLERVPQKMNERPPFYRGRDEVETMMSSASVTDWIALSELLLGPVEPNFRFTPKHKSNGYSTTSAAGVANSDDVDGFTAEG